MSGLCNFLLWWMADAYVPFVWIGPWWAKKDSYGDMRMTYVAPVQARSAHEARDAIRSGYGVRAEEAAIEWLLVQQWTYKWHPVRNLEMPMRPWMVWPITAELNAQYVQLEVL